MSSNEVTKEQILNTVSKLVAFESTENQVREQKNCLEEIEKLMEEKFEASWYSFDGYPALALSTSKNKTSDVILSGHIDVVPGQKQLFNTRCVKTKLYGRGTYDMKGPLVATLFAARDAVQNNTAKAITLLITADEETKGMGTLGLLKEGYNADFAIMLDGGDTENIIVEQKGFMQYAVTFQGVSTHASRPWEGKNAIIAATKFIQAVQTQYPEPASTTDWKTTVVPTKIEGGTVINQIPDSVTVYLDMRYVNQKDSDILVQWVKDTYKDEATISVVAENGMFKVNTDDKNLIKLQHVMAEQFGKIPNFSRECGTSDAFFFGEYDIPAALFRPIGGDAHGDNEWVDIDSLHMTYKVMYQYLHEKG